ncbi:MAG: YkgJ family cysteine cluster protein, partial [Zoogloea sp.]
MNSTRLTQLHTDIDERVRVIRTGHTDWLCGKGCDNCCKRLADVPQLTTDEWALLQEGLAALPPDQLGLITARIAALGPRPARPVTCP